MYNHSPIPAHSLRNLYFTRTAVQLLWAGSLAMNLNRPETAAALLVAYPLWDVACTLFELRSGGWRGSASGAQFVNVALGLATALAVGLTAISHPAYAVASFGAWALTAGVLQLIAGLARRRQLGGQWAMILSGAQSTLAGVAFLLGGISGRTHAKDLGGYAIFGAVYFLIAGILLSRRLSAASVATA